MPANSRDWGSRNSSSGYVITVSDEETSHATKIEEKLRRSKHYDYFSRVFLVIRAFLAKEEAKAKTRLY